MKQTVTFTHFYDAFAELRPDNFSRQGLEMLFDHLEALERDTGEDYELDVIALCCDFSEDSAETIVREHLMDNPDDLEDEELVEYVREQLEEETTVVGVTDAGTIVYRVF